MEEALRIALAREYPTFEPQLHSFVNDVFQSVYGSFIQRYSKVQSREQPSINIRFGVGDGLQLQDQNHLLEEQQSKLQLTDAESPMKIENQQNTDGFHVNILSPLAHTSNVDDLLDLPRFDIDNISINWPLLPNSLSSDEVLEPMNYVSSNLPPDLPTVGTEWEPRYSDIEASMTGELPIFDGGSFDLDLETNYQIPSETAAGPPSRRRKVRRRK
jgi:hypothetical protein